MAEALPGLRVDVVEGEHMTAELVSTGVAVACIFGCLLMANWPVADRRATRREKDRQLVEARGKAASWRVRAIRAERQVRELQDELFPIYEAPEPCRHETEERILREGYRSCTGCGRLTDHSGKVYRRGRYE